MKTNITTTLMALMMLLAFSCGSPCDEDGTSGTETKDFNQLDYSRVMPFDGSETLNFLKNGKDTIVYKAHNKEVFYNEVFRGDGDCLIKYRLLNHKMYFIDLQNESKLFIHYYTYSETNAFQDYFIFGINDNSQFGPYSTFSYFNGYPIANIDVLGVQYTVKQHSNVSLDSIYWQSNKNAQSSKRFVRIKHNNNVYEVLP
jgi:hypothetical protein